MFWENFVELCSQNGTSPNAVAAQLGKSSGSVTAWKNGTVPRETTLKKIADYFSVTVDRLIYDQKEKPSAGNGEELNVTNDDLRHLAAFHAADEDTKAAIRLLLAKFENGEG